MNPTVILCAIESSASGVSALVQAVELARWYDADLHVAHVRGGRAHRQVSGEPLKAGGVDPRLASFIAAADTEGLRLSTAVLAGDPVTAVTDYAKRSVADLVVVGTPGGRYGSHWRSGVSAKDLARVLPCPTLAVPDVDAPDARSSFVNILCATDFSAASSAAVQAALALTQQGGGRLTLLHVLEGFSYGTVYSVLGEYRAQVDRIARRMRSEVPADAFNWCQIDTRVVSGIAHRTIASTASELGADLIVMGQPERRGFDRVVMASTATPVLRSAACPVLLVRPSSGDVARVGPAEMADPEIVRRATEHISVGASAVHGDEHFRKKATRMT